MPYGSVPPPASGAEMPGGATATSRARSALKRPLFVSDLSPSRPASAPRSAPPAPRRHSGPLPPPPAVPSSVLAALRPHAVGSSDDVESGVEVSSAAPPGNDGSSPAASRALHPALQQAHAWLSEISAQTRVSGR